MASRRNWIGRAATRATAVGALVAAGTLSALIVHSLSEQARAADRRSQKIADALETRAGLIEEWSARTTALTEKQTAAMDEISMLSGAVSDEGHRCEKPEYSYGVGILQVAHVPASRGDDTEKFAAAQVVRLKTLLHKHSVSDWPRFLDHYLGRGAEPIRRVVFHNIDPKAGAHMCAWLRCQRWTGGCAFINERGETQVEEDPEAFEPSGDLYESWRVSMLDP